jgi:ParB-like chromosome segregation protein Spo0J
MRAREFTQQGLRIRDFPLRMVPVEQLRPWKPMTKMGDLPSQKTVASLTQTLQQGGRIPPLLATPVRGGYRIIDGHHRYFALQQAGIEQAPVRVVDPQMIRRNDEVRKALRVTLRRYGNGGRTGRVIDMLEQGTLEIARWLGEKKNRVSENFADGKKSGRKGLSKRVGIPQKATLGQLEKITKSSTGERRRMAQWQLNMRRGRKK